MVHCALCLEQSSLKAIQCTPFFVQCTPFFEKSTVLLEQSRNQERQSLAFWTRHKMKAPIFQIMLFFVENVNRNEQMRLISPKN